MKNTFTHDLIFFRFYLKSKIKQPQFIIAVLLSFIPIIILFYSIKENLAIIEMYSQNDKENLLVWGGFLPYIIRIFPFLCVILSADIFSGDYENRSAILLYSLPYTRRKIILLKMSSIEIIFFTINVISLIALQIFNSIILKFYLPFSKFLIIICLQMILENIWFIMAYFLSFMTKSTMISDLIVIIYVYIIETLLIQFEIEQLSITFHLISLNEKIHQLLAGGTEINLLMEIILPLSAFILIPWAIFGICLFFFNKEDIRIND